MLIAYHGGVIQVKSYPCVFDYVYVYQLTADEHDADGEDLLGVGVGRHVPEAHAGEAAEGEVEGRDVLVLDGRAGVGVGVIVGVAVLRGVWSVLRAARGTVERTTGTSW